MAAKTPVKAIFTGSDVTSLGEYTSSDTVAVANLGTGSPSSSNYLRGDGAWTAISDNDTTYTAGAGVTLTATEFTVDLNTDLGVTSTAAELNILDGVTSTAAELNILDGVTSTAAELNILDGVTSTAAELNYTDGVTSAIQTQLDTKLSSVADNSVTLAKMAGGTDGNLITYDASGDPAYVTTGTSGQVLTSGGVGVAPTFQAAAGVSTLAALTDSTISASDPVVSTNPSAVGHLWLNSSSGEAYICTSATTGDNTWTNIGPGTGDVQSPNTVDYLVIAGGGGAGGRWHGGGGGAGGYRNSYNSETSGGGGSSETALTFTEGTVYTITVGAGGAGGAGGNIDGASGNDSSISGTGITTVTSVAGGFGGGYPRDGGTGGSGGGGGGASGTAPSGAGTSNQGYAGGANNKAGDGSGGGGGGASEVGESTTNAYNVEDGGIGGDGLASSITGASVTRAGGGGGGALTAGAGGAGGGGSNGAGTANTGGGGGGTQLSGSTGGAGGSGVVILRMVTTKYSGTTSGSPTVTTDGSDTILVFTGSGTYTGQEIICHILQKQIVIILLLK